MKRKRERKKEREKKREKGRKEKEEEISRDKRTIGKIMYTFLSLYLSLSHGI